jgi:tetratricopeptide (TPR) repeat protein
MAAAMIAASASMAQDAASQKTPAPTVPGKEMEFSDEPGFKVAGVTDWTAVGGHGSDATLRTSESLARETLTLKAPAKAGESPHAEGTSGASADLHRKKAELAEKKGDPLAAVQELRLATELDASEENYFAWGSELLLHRAVWQAVEVFEKGAKSYPASARLKTAWGTALFSGALYEEAAKQVCEASDLAPEDAETYRIMGKIELASPLPLPCVEKKLARFTDAHPGSAEAKYLYAMALQKSGGEGNRQRVEGLLTEAVSLDPKCSDAYLQLGILAFAQHRYAEAIGLYKKAVETNPKLAEAHYRMALAYDRVGEGDKAKQELRIHDEIAKAQAEAVEQERRQIKQFVVTQEQPVATAKP